MKMTKEFKKLDETFNISDESYIEKVDVDVEIDLDSVEPIESDIQPLTKTELRDTSNDLKKDYEYTRGNLYSIIEKGQNAINGILELAEESNAPRAYEVAGQLIKNVAEVTEKLIDLQKKLKDIDEVGTKNPTNVTNALFIGSTAELSKLLKTQKKERDTFNNK